MFLTIDQETNAVELRFVVGIVDVFDARARLRITMRDHLLQERQHLRASHIELNQGVFERQQFEDVSLSQVAFGDCALA